MTNTVLLGFINRLKTTWQLLVQSHKSPRLLKSVGPKIWSSRVSTRSSQEGRDGCWLICLRYYFSDPICPCLCLVGFWKLWAFGARSEAVVLVLSMFSCHSKVCLFKGSTNYKPEKDLEEEILIVNTNNGC